MIERMLRVLIFGIVGFSAFLVSFIFSNLVNPSLSQSGHRSDDAIVKADFAQRILNDIGANSSTGRLELAHGLLLFVFASLALYIVMSAAVRLRILESAQLRSLLLISALTPGSLLALGLIASDLFSDDHSLRDALTGSYLTFSSTLNFCLRLSVIVIPIVFLIAILKRDKKSG
ncbi:hypothetical protein [Paragemmobacter aquarius]|uniref:hypothetical protein n=1 Tax=Paragemmobacter aquarius TaxID=2169400 RepID=UPI00131EF19C|nr:hypothetical protein [Gemmobacter aquarius]